MIALIVAKAKNDVIGNKGKIPWKIKGEQKLFKQLTTGNVVIMGRKSYEEIGHPLPNRMNVIISNSITVETDHCITCRSLSQAIEKFRNRDIYICGGYRLYKEALDIVDKMYITLIDEEFEGDTFFPKVDMEKFQLVKCEPVTTADINYSYNTYVRIRS